MAIYLSHKWRKQPQFSVGINWGHPITRQLRFLSMPGLPWRHDLVSKTYPTAGLLGPNASKTTPQGLAVYANDDVSSGWNWPTLGPVANTGTTGLTMLVVQQATSRSGPNRSLMLGNGAISAYNQATLAFNADKDAANSSGRFAVFEYDGGFLARADAASAIDGNWHVWVATRDAGTATYRLYKDGVELSTTSATGAGIAMTQPVTLDALYDNTIQGNGDPLSLAAVWGRALSSGEVAELSQALGDPYQLLMPIRRRIYSLPSAAAVTFQPAWASQANQIVSQGAANAS